MNKRESDVVFVELGDADRLKLKQVDVQDMNYSGLQIPLFVLDGSRLSRCRFEKLRVDGGSLGGGRAPSVFEECSFDGSRLRNVSPGRARFVRCSFRDVDIADWYCGEAEFVECVFSGVLRDGFFSAKVLNDEGLDRTTNEYVGNDFSEARLINMGFRGGVDLTRQRLPKGPEYVFIEDPTSVLPLARAQLEKYEDADVKASALSRLDVMREDVERGQQQLLLQPLKLRPTNTNSQKAELLLRRLLKETIERTHP